MPYNLNHSRRQACQRKVPYPTKEAAEKAANNIRRNGGTRITVYKCPNKRKGTHYHWGHNPKSS